MNIIINQEPNTKVYFTGLNGLRFIAALIVILYHVEFIKPRIGLTINNNFLLPGHQGVMFFFVLSGFLITYLLLEEFEKTGTIEVKKFYMRRILKIHPLYFLMVVIGFSIQYYLGDINKEALNSSLLFYVIFLPNISNAYFPLIENIYHLWTIGVEEVFYLFWPILFLRFKKNFILLCTAIIFLFGFGKPLLLYFYTHFFQNHNTLNFSTNSLNVFINLEFECMAIGAIGAYILFFKKEKFLKFIYSNIISYATLILVLASLFISHSIYLYINSVIYSVLYLIVILNVSTNPKYYIKLNNSLLEYLGKISYGIYMYHMFCIFIIMNTLVKIITIKNEVYDTLISYSLSVLFTIFVASLSYKFIEAPILKLKSKFTV